MVKQGNSASYWFEKSTDEDEQAAAPVAERRRIPSPLNLFARRLRGREEPKLAEPEAVAEQAQAIADDEPSMDWDAATLIAHLDDMPAAPVAETPPEAPEEVSLLAEVAAAVAEPAPAEVLVPVEAGPVSELPAPVMAPPAPPAPAAIEPPPAAEVVAPVAAPVAEAPAEPAPAPARRSSRVKTTFLGFEHSDGRIDDIFAREAKAEATPHAMFPVGWMVITDGPGRGTGIALQAGVSQIGRGDDQAIQLNFGDMAVSRSNHAAIAFDHEDRKFYLGHGGKTNIVRLNGRPVLSTETLETGDKIRIGETTMQFVAFCGPDFHWTA